MHNRLQTLFKGYLDDSLKPDELQEFLNLARQEENKPFIQEAIDTSLFENRFDGLSDPQTADRIFNSIIGKEPGKLLPMDTDFSITRGIRKRVIAKLSVAASVIILGSAAIIWLAKDAANHDYAPAPVVADAKPGGDKATLTLGDGTVILLDSVANGALANQGNVRISKTNGTLSYEFAASSDNETVLYNTISTPKGGQYEIVLPDGSRTKLNAESSLRFPTSFTGTERKVELTGQAFFEVTKQTNGGTKQPFIVELHGMSVEVLGTRFDVMGYSDEKNLVTTLVEGSVKIHTADSEAILKPGHQATVASGALSSGISVSSVDIEAATAWVNGLFHFDHADIRDIMRQAQRWYNIEVVYESTPSKRFSGTISRNVNLSELLKTLELTGNVRFRVEGRTVHVRS